MKVISELGVAMFNSIYSNSMRNFSFANDLMRQMNVSWKADEIVSECKVVLGEIGSAGEEKT